VLNNFSSEIQMAIKKVEWTTSSKFSHKQESYLVFIGKAGEKILLPIQFTKPLNIIFESEEEELDDEILFPF
jgi:hypothetical protein